MNMSVIENSALAGMKKYRATHRRIDYVPAANILVIIEQHRGTLDATLAGTIDQLIAAGHRLILSGNGKADDKGQEASTQ